MKKLILISLGCSALFLNVNAQERKPNSPILSVQEIAPPLTKTTVKSEEVLKTKTSEPKIELIEPKKVTSKESSSKDNLVNR